MKKIYYRKDHFETFCRTEIAENFCETADENYKNCGSYLFENSAFAAARSSQQHEVDHLTRPHRSWKHEESSRKFWKPGLTSPTFVIHV